MAQCFPSCSCDDLEGINRSDLDRFTDKIENLLTDKRGRQLFKDFMITAKLKDGKKSLNFWEECDRVINSYAANSVDRKIYEEFLCEVDQLIDQADRIEHLDFAIMEKLSLTRDSENKNEIITIIKLLKLEVARGLKNEYDLFRKHFLTKV